MICAERVTMTRLRQANVDLFSDAAAAGPEADLSVFRGHEVHRVASNATLTFEHTYTWWGERPAPVVNF